MHASFPGKTGTSSIIAFVGARRLNMMLYQGELMLLSLPVLIQDQIQGVIVYTEYFMNLDVLELLITDSHLMI